MKPDIRKIVTTVEEIYREGHGALARPLRVAVAGAVVKNPFAGVYEEDITVLSDDYSANLGPRLASIAAEVLGTKPKVFGKACIVGLAGEVQHGSAIIHTRQFGDPLRELTGGRAPVPAAEKRASGGASLDVPLRNAQDEGTLAGLDVPSLFTFEFRIADAPAADEIVLVAAFGDGGRPDPRRADD